MKLYELLELTYSKHKDKNPTTSIDDLYGIIYRIYCIPEDKSYIGQTYSHNYVNNYFNRYGVLNRMKVHYRSKNTKTCKNRPLYVALNKYSTDQFDITEEIRIYGKDLANINQIEGDYMTKYNSVYPNG